MSARFSPERAPGPPVQTVASFATYSEAEQAVDLLADHKFPVEQVAIIGRDLKAVERVTGRMTYGIAALEGALAGAAAGVLIGWLFGLFDWFNPIVASIWLAFHGLWFGAIVGALIGMLTHALAGGWRRNFASAHRIEAERYELVVAKGLADEAARVLSGAASATASPST